MSSIHDPTVCCRASGNEYLNNAYQSLKNTVIRTILENPVARPNLQIIAAYDVVYGSIVSISTAVSIADYDPTCDDC